MLFVIDESANVKQGKIMAELKIKPIDMYGSERARRRASFILIYSYAPKSIPKTIKNRHS